MKIDNWIIIDNWYYELKIIEYYEILNIENWYWIANGLIEGFKGSWIEWNEEFSV